MSTVTAETLENFKLGNGLEVTSMRIHKSPYETLPNGDKNLCLAKVVMQINHEIRLCNIRIMEEAEGGNIYVDYPHTYSKSTKNVKSHGEGGRRYDHFTFVTPKRLEALNNYILDCYEDGTFTVNR